jgi:peptidyl-prolyl cis-trans isomerase B (cyclophilin B)
LDGDYTVFGQVVEGLDVVDKIANAPRTPSPIDRPLEDIAMKVKIL